MKTIAEIRIANLQALIEERGTQDKVSELSGVSSVYLSQLKKSSLDLRSGKPRVMGNKTARRLEIGCQKPVGWMDVEHKPYPSAQDQPDLAHKANEVIAMPLRPATYDIWTMAAIDLMQRLDLGQRQAMVSRMREYLQFLEPPRVGQAL